MRACVTLIVPILLGAALGCSTSGTERETGHEDTNGPATGGSDTSGPGTGGSASGGSPVANVDCTQDEGIELDLLADFEDATTSLLNHPERRGSFYSSTDGSAGSAMEPPAGSPIPATEIPDGGRCGSLFALNIAGSGFTDWGANFATDLAYGLAEEEDVSKGSFDASGYVGISFWARIETGSAAAVRVGVRDKHTDPDGGICVADSTSSDRCYDAFGSSVALTSAWHYHRVPFSEMTQQGWGYSAPNLDTAALYAIAFQYGTNQDFDVWIDDLAFYAE
jgi:hypothetical protein